MSILFIILSDVHHSLSSECGDGDTTQSRYLPVRVAVRIDLTASFWASNGRLALLSVCLFSGFFGRAVAVTVVNDEVVSGIVPVLAGGTFVRLWCHCGKRSVGMEL